VTARAHDGPRMHWNYCGVVLERAQLMPECVSGCLDHGSRRTWRSALKRLLRPHRIMGRDWPVNMPNHSSTTTVERVPAVALRGRRVPLIPIVQKSPLPLALNLSPPAHTRRCTGKIPQPETPSCPQVSQNSAAPSRVRLKRRPSVAFATVPTRSETQPASRQLPGRGSKPRL